ncbi:hypothetical protein BN946_scf184868.g38 [Trametes cinnabarina]|uniref:Uncharacterized protein n=1 Tax=Pycnoporus cinnabarinus TaxID=5643 RepID=A0A060SWL6_PYCCI|nr:hypothetical protein BN946_scf184868.g38 [Trametes cinnabarina]
MEPEFIREQVKNVWRVLCSNEALIQERNLIIEGAFVGPDFVVNQASVLYDAVTDSVNLKANHAREHQFVIMRPEFLSQQGNALKAAIDDSARLQDTSKTTHTGLSSLTDTFILGMVNNLRDVMNDNSTVALQYRLRPNVVRVLRRSWQFSSLDIDACV